LGGFAANADSGGCSEQDRKAGTCVVDGSLTDDEAVLTGTQGGAGGSGSDGTGSGSGSSSEPELECPDLSQCRTTFTVAGLPTPTLSDLVGFRPTPGVDHMEPNGWFVVGLDANFYATGGTSVQSGTLLGYPASVRFIPIRWSWTYGDGASATKSTRGSTWRAQGIAEFDPTPTSHVYDSAGTYYIDLTIGYHVDYTFNGSTWGPIAGTLWLPANRLVATVGGAKTVLVERECTTNPAGPGC
jgi:hypothetical protein